MTRSHLIDRIVQNLSILSSEVALRNKLGLTEFNIFCEGFVCKILNIVYGFELSLLRIEGLTYPAIDLADHRRRIAVQVTSENNSKKVESTLATFMKFDLNRKFDSLYIFILTVKQKKYKVKLPSQEFDFNLSENVLDFADIGSRLFDLQMEKLEELMTFIESELGYLKNESMTKNVAGSLVSKIFIKDKNTFLVFADGQVKQISFESCDGHALIVPNQSIVVVIRLEQRYHSGRPYLRNKIVLIDINTLKETVLADQKPFIGGLDASFEILTATNPLVSQDGKYLYLVVDKYATASQLVKIEILTGKWIELFSTESFELIEKGEHQGKFLVSRSEIQDRGRDIYYRLYDEAGSVVVSFDDFQSFMEFRGQALGLR